jgi:hypothetical protein
MATEVRMALSRAIKKCPFDNPRPYIAAIMSELTGADISTAMINAWTAESHPGHRFPFEYAAAFEAATNSTELQELLAHKRGTMVLMGPEILDAQLGSIQRQKDELKERERALRLQMKGARK